MLRDIRPEYSVTRVNKAGKNVREGTHNFDDLIVIENWRACHNHILNAWQATLRGRCKNKDIIFAQRLKRRKTIFDKLKREPNMALAKMHDIAGCRLIFRDVESLNKYRASLHKARFKHERIKFQEDPYNYIKKPTSRGYRGIHDVYKFSSRSEEGEYWNGLQVEIQYRTSHQHAWATAVEVAGSLTGNHTKFDRGGADYKRFFILASEIIARGFEKSYSCEPEVANKDLVKEFDEIENRIKLLQRLKSIKTINFAITSVANLKRKNLILQTTHKEGAGIRIYSYDSLSLATKKYFELEKSATPDEDIVLVRAETHDSIRQAFKNYFSDTGDFTSLIENGIERLKNTSANNVFNKDGVYRSRVPK